MTHRKDFFTVFEVHREDVWLMIDDIEYAETLTDIQMEEIAEIMAWIMNANRNFFETLEEALEKVWLET